jgi:hypothetical protein
MNLPVKWNSAPSILLLIALTALIFCACDSSTEIGKDELDINRAGLETFVEDIDVGVKLYFDDSVSTTNRGQFLIGKTNDPNFGPITCKSFSRLSPTSYTDSLTGILPGDVYLSGRIVLVPDGYVYGDGEEPQSFQIFELGGPIESALSPGNPGPIFPTNNDPVFYSFHESLVSDRQIGRATFINGIDTISTVISNDFGQELLNLIATNTTEIFLDQETLNAFLFGLAFVPEDDNTAIFGVSTFNRESFLEIRYESLAEQEERTIRLFLGPATDTNNTAVSSGYYSVQIDPGREPFNTLINANEPIEPFDGKIYFQPFTGIRTIVDVSPFIAWREMQTNVILSDVIFQVRELENVSESYNPPQAIGYFNDSSDLFSLDDVNLQTPSIIRPTGFPVESFYNPDNNRFESSVFYFTDLLRDGNLSIVNYNIIPVLVNESGSAGFVVALDGLNGFVVDEGDIQLRVIYSTFN